MSNVKETERESARVVLSSAASLHSVAVKRREETRSTLCSFLATIPDGSCTAMETTCNGSSHHPINSKFYYQCHNSTDLPNYSSCCGLSSRSIQCLMYIFDLILATCGLMILVFALLYSLPNTSNVRSIIPVAHPINLVTWTTITTASLTVVISTVSLIRGCLLLCRGKKSQKLQVQVIRAQDYCHRNRNENEYIDAYEHADHSLSMVANAQSANTYLQRSAPMMSPCKSYSSSKVAQSAYSICSSIFIILFLLSLQLTVAIIGSFSSESFANSSEVSFYGGKSIASLMAPHGKEETLQMLSFHKEAFAGLQSQYKCCGFNGYTDYPGPVPDACCRSRTRDCGLRKHPSNVYEKGCGKKIERLMADELSLLSSIAFGMSCLQVLTVIFSSCLYILLLKRPTYL